MTSMDKIDRSREPARIERVSYDDERGKTVFVACGGREGGWGQSFGGYHLQDDVHRRWFMQDLCAVFGVADPELLVGKPCFVLRHYDRWGETIAGLESEETGRRFVAWDWCSKHWPDNVLHPLEQRRESLRSTVRWAERRAREARAELVRVEEGFVEWRSL